MLNFLNQSGELVSYYEGEELLQNGNKILVQCCLGGSMIQTKLEKALRGYRLGYSSAFLSAVETGRKKIPSDFFQRLELVYGLTEEKLESIYKNTDFSSFRIF